jgi:hypothetical protein
VKFILAVNAVAENGWAAFILLAGVALAICSNGHPDLKDAATMVIGGALTLFRSAAPSGASAATAVTAVTVVPKQ